MSANKAYLTPKQRDAGPGEVGTTRFMGGYNCTNNVRQDQRGSQEKSYNGGHNVTDGTQKVCQLVPGGPGKTDGRVGGSQKRRRPGGGRPAKEGPRWRQNTAHTREESKQAGHATAKRRNQERAPLRAARSGAPTEGHPTAATKFLLRATGGRPEGERTDGRPKARDRPNGEAAGARILRSSS